MRISEIAHLLGAEVISSTEDYFITQITIDSRSSNNTSDELFIALKGPNHDAHQYITELKAAGAQNFLVEDDFPPSRGCNVLKVDSTLGALQKLASISRQKVDIPVIGITGSNGKTIVKEWLSTILSVQHNVLKSPKSYNSQVGVPLSVWPLGKLHHVGVFEAGISQPGEMDKLEKIIAPTMGILTNIGTAHDEFFESRSQKADEKLQLFINSQKLIYQKGDEALEQLIDSRFSGEKLNWSFESGARYRVVQTPNNIKVNDIPFSIPFSDEASVENLIHCIVAAFELGLSADEIQEGISQINQIKMRLELKKGINNCYLIDDTYNNDFAGLQKALDFMDQQEQTGHKTVILSDFPHSRQKSDFYQHLNKLLIQKGIGRLVAIGPDMVKNKKAFSVESSFYQDTTSFLGSAERRQFKNELILIKGGRQFGLERISKALSEKAHKTVLEINLDAITHNLNFYRSLLKPGTKIMVVVKALAYGAGSAEIGKMLEFHKVDYLAVAYADEGIALRKSGISLPIMVMNASEDDIFNLMQYDLEPEIYSLEQLRQFHHEYVLAGKVLSAHIILNTGMNRLGFNAEELDELTLFVKNARQLEVKSTFTHLAASEEERHEAFTQSQVAQFRDGAEKLESVLGYKPIRHILNSGGIVRHNDFQEDMVRLGIGLHGVEVSMIHDKQLQHPATLKTVVSQVRRVKKGETIGYGRKGQADKDMRVATIAIGYADGYLRYFGNGKAYVSINGQQAPTIGNICMDMSMIDVTDINASVGDEVIVFGKDPSISQLAEWAQTIPYEILTNVSGRVKRVFYSE